MRHGEFRHCALVMVAAVLVLSFQAPAASASLLGEAGDAVRSAVKKVEGAVKETVPGPTAPQVPAPTPPPPPIDPGPAAVPQPATPQEAPAGREAAAPRTAGDDASVGDVAGAGTQGLARQGTDTSSQAPERAAAPPPERAAASPRDEGSSGPVSALGRGSDPAGAGGAAAVAPSGSPAAGDRGAPSIHDRAAVARLPVEMGDVLVLQRWLAYVWPAVALALAADDGELAGGSAVGKVLEQGLLRPAAATVRRFLLAASSAIAASDGSPAAGPGPATGRFTDLLGSMSTDRQKILYLIGLLVLLAVFAITVWREFRAALRPGVRMR